MNCNTHKTNLPTIVGLLSVFFLLASGMARYLYGQTPQASSSPGVDFQKEVRPILANHCFACHGFDDKSRQADLRLDLPGDPKASQLIQRIQSHDPDLIMPPASTNKPLSNQQKEILQRWIAQGAQYEKHWALAPPSRTELPDPRAMELNNDHWVQNPIDVWVGFELQNHQIQPSPPADAATLARRLYLDLLGTIPSPDELIEFQSDSSPNKIDRLIEKLLASPQFGERWGRFWLDQARYADSNGFTIDGVRNMWPYRDWVIAAINADMPFDQFTIEQLAGDLLHEPSKNQLIASAFHRNTMINEEGGVKADQYRHEAIIDRVNTTGAVWLGLTIGCAQCHTHKYDPISIDDYYRLYAFFNACADNNSTNPTIEVLEGEVFGLPESVVADLKELQQLNQKLRKLEAQIQKQSEASPPDLQWQQVLIQHAHSTADPNQKESTLLIKLDDGSVLVPETVDGNATLHIEFVHSDPLAKPITAVRLRTLIDDSLPQKGPGKASNGNFVLSEFQITANQVQRPIQRAWADHSQPKYPVEHAIDSDPKTGWAINTDAAQVKAKPDLKMNAPHLAVFALSKPIESSSNPIEVKLLHQINKDYLVGRLALDISISDIPSPKPVDSPSLEELKSQIAQISSRLPNQGKLVLQMIYRDQTNPPATYRLLRGDFLSPDKQSGVLTPTIPSVFREGQDLPMQSRLDLARWLVSRENPLTARVMVNRIWMKLFGTGLVETENDFGLQGAAPSHPELLDWLANDWVDSGWSLKRLMHRITTSATYQQSSSFRSDLAQIDPGNRWLARQSRIRLDAQILRDQALSASGALTTRIGGPSVHPPQPSGIYNFTQNVKTWKEDTGANRFRRTMYTEFFRSAPYPLWTTFDSPDFSTVCTRRSRTNTPLQALTLANDPVFWELAIQLADRSLRETPESSSKETSLQGRIQRMVELAWCRRPTQGELDRLTELHASVAEYYRQNPDQADPLNGLSVDQAANAQVARVLMNTDEFVNRE